MATPSSVPMRTASSASADSVTAMDYINTQLQLESEAREALPYSFDSCTRPLGSLRQPVYACKTCIPLQPTPSPAFGTTSPTGAAALCYSCSISCHGDHELVEIFDKRGIRCDCGTGRLPGVSCELRKAVDEPVDDVVGFSQNFWGKFCSCEIQYDPDRETGMMYQCLLGDACHEDWFHDACVVGKGPVVYLTEGKDLEEKPDTKKDAETSAEAPETANIKTVEEEEDDDEDETRAESLGFPKDFEHTICWHCVEANPFLKRYAAYPGFFALARPGDEDSTAAEAEPELHSQGQKRKAEDDGADINGAKRILTEDNVEGTVDNPTNSTETTKSAVNTPRPCTLPELPSSLPKSFSLLLPSTFRTALCRCPSCFSFLSRHRVLLEHEETHQLPLSRSASPTGSIFEEGERALNGMDRVRAIEGVMAYNKLKDRIKAFLEPFAKSGKAVGVDDVKGYFEELKGEGKA